MIDNCKLYLGKSQEYRNKIVSNNYMWFKKNHKFSDQEDIKELV